MGGDEKLFVREGSAWVEHPVGASHAEQLSRDRQTYAVAWSIHTAVDQIWILAYRDGTVVRELQYTPDDGWTKRGDPLPFENTATLNRWLRKRRLFASPHGYDVLDAFLGNRPVEPVTDPGATYATSFAPVHASELRTIAERAHVTVSEIFEASWHLGKQRIYDRLMARALRLGLDLSMLVDDTSAPAPLEALPAFVHDPVAAPAIDLVRYAASAIPHQLALSARMLAELEHMYTMFDVKKYDLLDEAYLLARPQLV